MSAASPAAARPTGPAIQIASPSAAPARVRGRAADPRAVVVIDSSLPRARLPPMTAVPSAVAASRWPAARASRSASLTHGGSTSADRRPTGAAPIAARSLPAAIVAR